MADYGPDVRAPLYASPRVKSRRGTRAACSRRRAAGVQCKKTQHRISHRFRERPAKTKCRGVSRVLGKKYVVVSPRRTSQGVWARAKRRRRRMSFQRSVRAYSRSSFPPGTARGLRMYARRRGWRPPREQAVRTKRGGWVEAHRRARAYEGVETRKVECAQPARRQRKHLD